MCSTAAEAVLKTIGAFSRDIGRKEREEGERKGELGKRLFSAFYGPIKTGKVKKGALKTRPRRLICSEESPSNFLSRLSSRKKRGRRKMAHCVYF